MLQKYMSKELNVEVGQLDADFLLDFISKEMRATITIGASTMPKPF
jgi:uncharacterized protein (DUF2164 family)